MIEVRISLSVVDGIDSAMSLRGYRSDMLFGKAELKDTQKCGRSTKDKIMPRKSRSFDNTQVTIRCKSKSNACRDCVVGWGGRCPMGLLSRVRNDSESRGKIEGSAEQLANLPTRHCRGVANLITRIQI